MIRYLFGILSSPGILAAWLTALASIAIAIAAWRGLTTWRSQTRAEYNRKLAVQLLRRAYAVLHAIRHIRNPMMLSPEIASAMKDLPEEAKVSTRKAVLDQRRPELSKAIGENLDVDIREATLVWDFDVDKLFEPLRKQIGHLLWAFEMQRMIEREEDGPPSQVREEKWFHTAKAILNAPPKSEEDEYGQKVESAVAAIEGAVTPYLVPRKSPRLGRRGSKPANSGANK